MTNTIFVSTTEAAFFNYVQQLRNDFEAKHKTPPEYLLINPNDLTQFNHEMKNIYGKVVYAIPVVPTTRVAKGLPIFVKT